MKNSIIIFFVSFFGLIPAYSQVDYHNLRMQADTWSPALIETKLIEKLSNLFEYQKQSYIPLVNSALKNYQVVVVFHAIIDKKAYYNNSEIKIDIESNDFPLDVFFIDKNKEKLMVLTYDGNIEIVDTRFRTLMIGLANKMKKSFRFIVKQNPDIIFICDDLFGCFFYIKNGIVYIYDYYHNDNKPVQKYSRLPELLSIE